MKKLVGVYWCKNCGKFIGDFDLERCPKCNEKVYMRSLIEKDIGHD